MVRGSEVVTRGRIQVLDDRKALIVDKYWKAFVFEGYGKLSVKASWRIGKSSILVNNWNSITLDRHGKSIIFVSYENSIILTSYGKSNTLATKE